MFTFNTFLAGELHLGCHDNPVFDVINQCGFDHPRTLHWIHYYSLLVGNLGCFTCSCFTRPYPLLRFQSLRLLWQPILIQVHQRTFMLKPVVHSMQVFLLWDIDILLCYTLWTEVSDLINMPCIKVIGSLLWSTSLNDCMGVLWGMPSLFYFARLPKWKEIYILCLQCEIIDLVFTETKICFAFYLLSETHFVPLCCNL